MEGNMNQEQRKFLIGTVEKTCDKQIKDLEDSIPDKPSLNNYLIAAFMDNSIQFNDIQILKDKMRKAVLKFGHSDQLIEEDSGWRSRKERSFVKIDPEDLFVLPQAYLDALREYESIRDSINKKIKDLENAKNTIVLKLQIGSAVTLDKIVMQVDNIGDLNLMNTQLLLEKNDK